MQVNDQDNKLRLGVAILWSMLFLLSVFFAQNIKAETHKEVIENVIMAPDSWRKERIAFPLSFAPSLDYQGFEDVRFAPGWSHKDQQDFWTYAFAWYLDIDPLLSAEKLNRDFNAYYDGLMQLIAQGKKIPLQRVFKTSAHFTKASMSEFYQGKVSFFDAFFTEEKVNLNIKARQKYCRTTNKYVVFFMLSPQTEHHPIWNTMEQMQVICQSPSK